ncbi:hypothetical protein [Rhodococcus sp. HNM0569]|uniref:hypothetical protein n=1 Tax=Rhodococcus sp. HNM0569 TaxID=2716340 RepID=UPI00146F800C|nr:hypothetical protein [Rhodococcus sp. HNM0569]
MAIIVFATPIALNSGIRGRFLRWRTTKHALTTEAQEAELHARFDGHRRIVTIDPRRTTVPVARMNAIANGYGYYYIGENGNHGESIEVAFQQLPGPPPLRVPSSSNRWTPVEEGGRR